MLPCHEAFSENMVFKWLYYIYCMNSPYIKYFLVSTSFLNHFQLLRGEELLGDI